MAKIIEIDSYRKKIKKACSTTQAGEYKEGILHYADMYDPQLTTALIQSCRDVNYKDDIGVTPLHLAAEKDTTGEFVSELIRLGADVNLQNRHKLTPIHYAVNNKKPDAVLQVMLNPKPTPAELRYATAVSTLEWATIQQNIDVVEILLKIDSTLVKYRGISHGIKDSAVEIAIASNNIQLITTFIKNGDCIDLTSQSSYTPVMFAALNFKDSSEVRLWIDAGADIFHKSKDGENLFHMLAQNRHRLKISDMEYQYLTKLLAGFGLKINVKDSYGYFPIHRAAICCNANATHALVATGSKVNVRNTQGKTPLHFAVENNDINNAQILLSAGANITTVNKLGKTPIDVAKEQNYREMLKLLQKYSSPSGKRTRKKTCESSNIIDITKYMTQNDEEDTESYYTTMNSPLHREILEWNTPRSISLIQEGADVNATNSSMQTPVHFAVSSNLPELLYALIIAGAKVDVRDSITGDTPIHYDIRYCMFTTMYRNNLAVLVKYGCDINAVNYNGLMPIHMACKLRSTESMLVELLKLGADVNVPSHDEYKRPPIYFAIDNPVPSKTIVALANAGANLRAIIGSGLTPLQYAVSRRNMDAVKTLLEIDKTLLFDNWILPLKTVIMENDLEAVKVFIDSNISTEVKDEFGMTPIMIAIQHFKDISEIKIWIEAGADIFKKHEATDTLFHILASRLQKDSTLHERNLELITVNNQYLELIKLLSELGLDINQPNLMGYHPIHVAAEKGNTGVLVALVESGADVNTVVYKGSTALHIAATLKRPSPNMIQTLLLLGADINATDCYGKKAIDYATDNRAIREILSQYIANRNKINEEENWQ